MHLHRAAASGCATGWAGARLARDIDCAEKYDLTIISPKNHMVFTPLLAATTVGTLSVQSVIEHIRHLQPALRQPQNQLYMADALRVDADEKIVTCRALDGLAFDVSYDKLAICTGAQGSTFGIQGVRTRCRCGAPATRRISGRS